MNCLRIGALVFFVAAFVVGCGGQPPAPTPTEVPKSTEPEVFEDSFEEGKTEDWTDAEAETTDEDGGDSADSQ